MDVETAVHPAHPFDRIAPEAMRAAPSAKWHEHDADVLPLWVADMDFPVAAPIRDALRAHTEAHPFVYPDREGVPGLREALVARLASRYGWEPAPESVHLLPGIVPGLFQGVRALASPGEGVLVSTPAYPPFLMAVERQGRTLQAVDLELGDDGWRLDAAAVAAAVTPATRLLLICNPHNPTGRVFGRAELEPLAELALEHRLWVVSDELHADLSYGAEHVPFASLGPEVAARTVTLYGPTKAFNIAGLKVGFAVAENAALLERFGGDGFGLVPPPNVLAQVAARAALGEADAWLDDALAYLARNRARVAEAVAGWPGVRYHPPEATYLAWFDLRGAGLGERPAEALVERARVALNEGADYGPVGTGFARLNFATSRAILDEALGRLGAVLG